MEIDIYALQVGDKFIEDCYPETYQVVEVQHYNEDFGSKMVLAKCLENGAMSEWGYTDPAYSPVIFKVD